MKRSVVLGLAGVFLFGAFALPGKVCSSAHGRPGTRAAEADVPPCHRAANPSATPCDRMVCCLVPEAERSAVAAPALPAPVVVWTGVPATLSAPLPVTERVAAVDLFHPPPGLSAGFRLAFSLRAPPVPA